MAYVDQDLEEELEGGGSVVPGGGVSNNAPTASAAPAPGAGPKQKTPGRFADLGEYLRVNQPQQFGEQLAGKVGADIDKGQQALAGAQDEFRSRADASTIRDTQGLIDQVGSSPETVDADAFAHLRDASYSGPAKLTDTADLYNKVQGAAGSAVGKAGAAKTEGGRFALLDSYFGKPSYSQGQKSLDNLLVQNDPNSKQAFDQMQQNAQGLQANVNQAGVDLGNYGAGAKAATEGTRSSARGALGIDDAGNLSSGGAFGELLSQLDQNVEARRQAAQDQYGEFGVLQNANNLSGVDQALLDRLGLNPAEYGGFQMDMPSFMKGVDRNVIGQQFSFGRDGAILGANPYQFVSQVAPDAINRGSVANADQVARLAALQKLAGMEGSVVDNIDQAGTYTDSPLTNFNKQAFDAAYASKAGQYMEDATQIAAKYEDMYKNKGWSKETAKENFLHDMNQLKQRYGVQ